MMETNLAVYKSLQSLVEQVFRRQLFFVMGVPKSGTTWVQQLLNGHPQIRCSGEDNLNQLRISVEEVVNRYNYYMECTNRGIGTESYGTFDREKLKHLFLTAMGLLLCDGETNNSVKLIGSKTPVVIKNCELYGQLLPQAKFVHVVRDGRDVMVSLWFNNMRVDKKGTMGRWKNFCQCVESGVREWVHDIRNAREFGKKYPDRYHEVRYEELNRNLKMHFCHVLEFLGVTASESMTKLCIDAGNFEKHANGRRRGQEDRDSFFRKGVVGDWKNHFDKKAMEAFEKIGGNLLRELGYEPLEKRKTQHDFMQPKGDLANQSTT